MKKYLYIGGAVLLVLLVLYVGSCMKASAERREQVKAYSLLEKDKRDLNAAVERWKLLSTENKAKIDALSATLKQRADENAALAKKLQTVDWRMVEKLKAEKDCEMRYTALTGEFTLAQRRNDEMTVLLNGRAQEISLHEQREQVLVAERDEKEKLAKKYLLRVDDLVKDYTSASLDLQEERRKRFSFGPGVFYGIASDGKWYWGACVSLQYSLVKFKLGK